MSTSCVIALYSKEDDEIVLLEKTHDGYFETVKFLISEAMNRCSFDLEDTADYLLKNTDVRFSIYSHKYPSTAFIYLVDTKKFIEVEIDSKISKIKDCLQDVRDRIEKIK